MNCNDLYPALDHHVRDFFRGHEVEYFTWPAGPILKVLPRLRVARVSPGPRTPFWTYLSIGAWEVNHDATGALEFVMISPYETERVVEFLAMAAHYHYGNTLGEGHTYPIGEPWLSGSTLDHILVCLPYPFGPDLGECHVPDGHVYYLWLLPITESERNFKAQNGLEALESRFEAVGLDYSDPIRSSVV